MSALFGLGFSGIIPAYALIARELFAAREAGWRIPLLLFCSGAGMASGGWFAGLLYDHFGYYAPAFAAGLIFNAVNLLLIGMLVWRRASPGGLRPAMASIAGMATHLGHTATHRAGYDCGATISCRRASIPLSLS